MEEYFLTCPYCWQPISVMLDLSVRSQTYIEDCEKCCNPLEIRYRVANHRVVEFDAQGARD